jgi:pre-rRNA-processing protein TSR3
MFEMGNLENRNVSVNELGEFPRVFAVEFREDDPAKCTSAKMIKFRLARSIRPNQIARSSIVLSPFGSEIILNTDKATALSGGLVVIDCSWVNATSTFKRRLNGIQRRLPVLMAGNPTNYSKLNSLSSIEATAGALYIMNFREYSTRLLSLYKWGGTFLSLNEDALNDYSTATSQEEIKKIELDYFPRIAG